jgi:hypothetical protein
MISRNRFSVKSAPIPIPNPGSKPRNLRETEFDRVPVLYDPSTAVYEGGLWMFESCEELTSRLSATGYFIDPVMIKVVYLASRMQKPLLLEGPAGSGKTQLAVSVAKAAGTHIERLQCYRGVTEDQAIGKFDEGLQRLYMEFARGEHADWQSVQASLKGRDFFRAGPLMRALLPAQPGPQEDRRLPVHVARAEEQPGLRAHYRRGRSAEVLLQD